MKESVSRTDDSKHTKETTTVVYCKPGNKETTIKSYGSQRVELCL